MRALCSTIDEQAVRKNLLRGDKSYEETRDAIIKNLFSVDSLDNATMRLNLPKHQVVKLNKSKLDGLAKKLLHSQQVSFILPKPHSSAEGIEKRATLPGFVGSKRKDGRDDNKGLVKRRRVGRPVLPIASVVGAPSIPTFLITIKGVE